VSEPLTEKTFKNFPDLSDEEWGRWEAQMEMPRQELRIVEVAVSLSNLADLDDESADYATWEAALSRLYAEVDRYQAMRKVAGYAE